MGKIEAFFDRGQTLTLFRVSGSVTDEDFIAAIERHFAETPTSYVIWNVLSCDLSGLDMPGLVRISEVAKRLSRARSNPRTIIVVGQSQEVVLMKLYEEINELSGSPVRYELVHSLGEAFDLLGIADPFAGDSSIAG